MVYAKDIGNIEIRHVLIYMSVMFNKVVTCSTINSAKCLVTTILHISTYLSKTKHLLVKKNIAGIFNLKLPKPKLSNVWDLDILVRYFERLER